METNEGHTMDLNNLHLVKEINDKRKLRFYEAIQIHSNESNLMNGNLGNLNSPLLAFFPFFLAWFLPTTTVSKNIPGF